MSPAHQNAMAREFATARVFGSSGPNSAVWACRASIRAGIVDRVARWRDSVRDIGTRPGPKSGLAARNKIQRSGIHAVTEVSGWRAIVEDVSQVGIAPAAKNLLALHAERIVLADR